MVAQGQLYNQEIRSRSTVFLMVLVAGFYWGSSPALVAETTALPVLATFFDGADRREISHELYRDYLLYHGFDPQKGNLEPLESLALLLWLEAEALGGESDPRVALEMQVEEDRLLAADERRSVLALVSIDEKAVERRVEELRRQGLFKRPKKVHLRELFLAVPAGADSETRELIGVRAAQLRQRLLEGEDFGALARAESDSQNAVRGGRLGVVRPGTLPEQLEEIIYALEEGELTGLLESPAGFFVFRCDRIVEMPDTTLEEARSRARAKLLREANEARAESLRRNALEGASPSISPITAAVAPEETVLSFAGGRLSQREAAWLTRMEPGGAALNAMGPPRLRKILENHVVRSVLAERRRGRPLGEDLERRVRWQRRSILAEAGLRRRVEAQFRRPTDPELQAYIEANPERFVRREHYRLAVLRVDVDPSNPQEAGRLVAEVSRLLELGELTFGEAARKHSDHFSASQGGEVGWWSRKRVAIHGLPLLRAVAGLEGGERTGAIRQDRSWWMLKLFEVEAPRPLTFDEARPRAELALGNERLRFLQEAVEREVRQALELRIVPVTTDETTRIGHSGEATGSTP